MISYNSENNFRDGSPFCHPFFGHSIVVNYASSLLQSVGKLLWDLTTKYFWNRPPKLAGWIRPGKGLSDTIVLPDTSISKPATIVQCFEGHSISVFRFYLLHLKNCTLTNVRFPNIQCIYRAKFTSFGNLSLLTNFQKISAVWPNTVSIVHCHSKVPCLFKIKLHTTGMSN